jgi:serine protease
VAGTIAEATHNNVGVAGLAHQATIMPLKIFPAGEQPQARESDMLDAIRWAVDRGAQVVNLSLGGGGGTDAGREVFAEASAEAVLICASGNDGEAEVDYPGAYDGCLTVGAVALHEPGEEGVRSEFSNYGAELDLVAPGEDVVQEGWTAEFGTAYFRASGTSTATPHVSAVAAMMIARAGTMDVDAVRQAIVETAQDIGAAGWGPETGWGEVDAAAAVDTYAERFGEAPVASFSLDKRAALRVHFDASDSVAADGAPATYFWEFGDGITSAEKKPTHRYATSGTFGVFLTVTDANGMTDTEARAIDVEQFADGTANNPFGCGMGRGGTPVEAFPLALATALILAFRRRAVRQVREGRRRG